MDKLIDIKPLQGLGNIEFGFTRNQVKAIVGEPSEVDTFQYDEDNDEELTESWHYDEKELSFSFEETEDWKLVNIAISAEEFRFEGKKVIGLSKSNLIKTLESLDIGTINEDNENAVVSIIASQINFWFDGGEVAEVQWNVDWDDDGEAVFPGN